MRFQKRLLTGVRERAMERSATGHAAHAKYVGQLPLSADIRVGFIPVHLRFSTPNVGLWNERLVVSWTRPLPLPASLLGSCTRSDVRCAAASVVLACPLPEPRR